MYKLSAIVFFALVLVACVKDKPDNPIQPQVQLSGTRKVYVINEGPFQNGGNGSISLYDPGNSQVVENFYQVQNNAQIGNVAQSLSYIDGNYYIVVNNAGKILVCDNQFRKKAQISGLNSPRYMLPVTNRKAYVSDLYANAISIVDLNTNTKIGSIPCFGKTERMALLYNKAFVTNTDMSYVYVINTLMDAVTDSVLVGKGAASIVVDRNDRIWVLGAGETSGGAGKLTRINPLNNTIEKVYSFAAGELPGSLCLNKTKDTLFFLNGGIYRMSISETGLPPVPFVARGSKNFYGLGVNPNDYNVYAADALDYSQRSQIYIYRQNGTSAADFKAGIISNGFYFE